MTRSLTSLAACLALAGAALAGGAGTAQGAQPTLKFRSAWFKASIEGVQTNSWTHKHVKSFDCDSNSEGKGTEVIRFKSKPVKVKAFQVGDSQPMFSGVRGSKNELDLSSKITRRGERKDWGAKVCSYGDGKGGQTPRPPDCGTKRNNSLSVEFDYGQKNRIEVVQTMFLPLGPFFNCPNGGTSWPSLLDRTNRGAVGKRYAPNKLFGKKRKHVIEAAGREEVNTGEDTSVTTMHWYLTLKRTKAPKGKK